MAEQGVKEVEFDGQVYEFPSDATDAEIDTFLRAADGPSQPTPTTPTAPSGRALDRRMLTGLIPIAAGAMAAPFTGGMSIPAAMAVTGGAAAGGGLLRDVLDGIEPSVGRAAGDAAMSGPLQGLGRLLGAAKGPVQAGARKLWQYAAGGGSNKTAEAIMSQGAGWLRRGNLKRLETPRSPTGAFQPRQVSPTALEAMRHGVERANTTSGMPTREMLMSTMGLIAGGGKGAALAGLAATATRPMPASFIAQRAYDAAPLIAATGRHLPTAGRATHAASVVNDESQQETIDQLRARGIEDLLRSR